MRRNLWILINLGLTAVVVFSGFKTFSSLNVFVWFAIAHLLVVAVFDCYALWRRGTKSRMDFLALAQPFFYLLGFYLTLATISFFPLRIFFAIAGAAVFYFIQYYLFIRPPAFFEDLSVLTTGFLLLVAVWSLNFFFAAAWWLVLLLVLVTFFPIFLAVFYKTAQTVHDAVLWSLVCVLIMGETAWSVLFWPVHFMTAAVTVFTVFYLLYEISQLYIYHHLTLKKVYFQVAIIAIVLAAAILSSPWLPAGTT